jgi:hypothetical protein
VSHIVISAEIINVYWQIVDRMDTYIHTSQKQNKSKYEDSTKTKYVADLMDKAIPRLIKFKMNFIDMRLFFNTAYSVSNNNRLFSDCTLLSEIQI